MSFDYFVSGLDPNNDGEGRFCTEVVHTYAIMGVSGSVCNWADGWLLWLVFVCQSHRWIDETYRLVTGFLLFFGWIEMLGPIGFSMILAFCDLVGSGCFTELRIFIFASDELPQCSSIRVPKIRTIFGIIGLLKLLAGDKFEFSLYNYVPRPCFTVFVCSCHYESWTVLDDNGRHKKI